MGITKKYNFEYDGASPNLVKNIGDRFFSQDQSRQYNYFMDRIGLSAYDLTRNVPMILSGLIATKGAGDTISISAGVCYAKYEVDVQTGAWTNPPSVTQEDIEYIRIVVGTLTDQATTSKNDDNATTNYIKISYTDTDGNTRTREKKAGTYAYEQTPAYTLTIDDVAPTDYDVVIGSFVTAGAVVPTLIDYTENTFKSEGFNYRSDYRPSIQGQIGASLGIAGIGVLDLTALNTTSVAFIDATLASLRTYVFSDYGWAIVGAGDAIAGMGNPAICALSSTRIAFIDDTNNDLRVYDWDGANWTQTGSDLVIAGVDFPKLCALSSTRVAFIDTTNEDLRIYDWNGTIFSQTGNDLNIAGIGAIAICALDSKRIAFYDTTNDDLRTYEFNEVDWAQVGNDLNFAGAGNCALCSLNYKTVAFMDNGEEDLRIYQFDDTDWELIDELNIAGAGSPALASITSNHVAFIDETLEVLTTYGITWSAVVPTPREDLL